MDDKQSGQLSPQQLEINKVVNDTMKDVNKLEGDIKKLPSRGTLELNYNPPGMPNINSSQIAKDITKLKDNIELFKTNAIAKADEIIATLPADQQTSARQNVHAALYPQLSSKPLEEKTTDSISAAQKNMLQHKADYLREEIPVSNEKISKFQEPPAFQSRFAQTLNYSIIVDRKNSEPAKEKNTGKDAVTPKEKTEKDDR